MEQGGLMPSTTAPSTTLKSSADAAEVQLKPQPQVVSLSNYATSTSPTNSVTKGEYVQTETLTNTTNGVYPQRPTGGTKVTVSRYGPYNQKRVVVTKSSINTPKFRELVRTGGILPVNPFRHSSTTTNYVYRKSRDTIYTNGFVFREYLGEGPWPSSYTPQAQVVLADLSTKEMEVLDREARLKIRLKLKDMSVSVAQIIAERDKSAASIAKIVKTIAEVILKLRKGDLVGAAGAVGQHVGYRRRRQHDRTHRGNPTEAAANAWLELQYAIKPLLMDIDGICKALAAHKYPKATGTAVATVDRTIDRVTRVPVTGGERLTINQGSVKIRYTVYFQIDYPEMPNLASLGLTNPALLAWELVPFSFVLDWLLPIGDWLSSLDATVGLRFADGSKSVKKDITQTITQKWRTTTGPSPFTWGTTSTEQVIEDTSSQKLEEVVRTKLSSFPDVAFPPFKNPASLMHLATSMALLRKAFT